MQEKICFANWARTTFRARFVAIGRCPERGTVLPVWCGQRSGRIAPLAGRLRLIAGKLFGFLQKGLVFGGYLFVCHRIEQLA